MRRPSVFPVALSLAAVLGLAGCSEPTPVTDAAAPTDAGASQRIGPAGGVIFAPGLTLTVPPGALTASVVITLTRTDEPVPAGHVGYSPVWRFAPAGQVFARPVSVEMTFVGDHPAAGLFWSRPAGGYERLAGAVVGDHLAASISHFSLGFVGDLLGLDAGGDASTDRPEASIDGADGAPLPDAPDVPTAPPIPAPRPIAPLTGSHVPSRRPALRWSLPAGVTTARVTLCRDRALTSGCVSFEAAGATAAPAADLAPGVWFWALRGVVGGVVGGPVSPVWRLRLATATTAAARPWGSDPDVNGDGYADLLAAVLDVAVSVFPGGPAGPATTPVTRPAPLDSTHFGQGLDHAGDVDGDGYSDVVVGAPGSNGVYLYRGAATGLGATPTVLTGAAGSGLGSSVTGAGDVNGDGFDDVVAVVPTTNAVWVLPGSATGLGAPVRVTVPLTSEASVVTGAGDVDGDGYADVLLGGGPSSGSGQLLRGGASGLVAARALAVDPSSVPAGDLNGDGLADLAYGTSTTARVVRGASVIDLTGSPLTGPAMAYGTPVARGGDFNGDGFDDLTFTSFVAPGGASGVGPPVALLSGFGSATVQGPVGAGDVDGDGADDLLTHQARTPEFYLTRGSSAGLVLGRLTYTNLGTAPYNFDVPRAAVGDVDHDGHADLGLGSSIYRGSATGLIPTPVWRLARGIALTVAAAGDVNRDGFADVAVLSADSNSGTVVGTFSVYLGSATGPGTTAVVLQSGVTTSGYFSIVSSMSGAGDVNRDGFADVLVGLNTASTYLGRAPFTAPFSPVDLGGSAIRAVGSAGDVNNDGFADVLMRSDGPTATTRVVAGSATGAGATLATLPSTALPVALGDVNGDRFADLAVPTATGIGIHLGSSAGPAATPTTTLPGFEVFAAGDVNHDGHPDLIVRREGLNRNLLAGLFLGTATGFGTAPSLVWPDAFFLIGTPGAAGFGDVDGDGFDDVIVLGGNGAAVQRFDAPGPRPVTFTLADAATAAGTIYR